MAKDIWSRKGKKEEREDSFTNDSKSKRNTDTKEDG